ncbi:MAG TPA: cupin domain-containing protein [Gammaproteobacteria bacterium]|nr:cupin domain-containing protein [Gammaproteobacteria bacterium]
MIAKHGKDITPRTSSGYPEPFRSRVVPREKRALGNAFGMDKIGVNLTRLPPGVESSMRHWHEHEDELIYVLEGELVLRTDMGEERLTAGMFVGFKAGNTNAHQFFNPGLETAVYLEISNRVPQGDRVHYADVDLLYGLNAQGHPVYTHKDGTPY